MYLKELIFISLPLSFNINEIPCFMPSCNDEMCYKSDVTELVDVSWSMCRRA